jgi:hypothetical protein
LRLLVSEPFSNPRTIPDFPSCLVLGTGKQSPQFRDCEKKRQPQCHSPRRRHSCDLAAQVDPCSLKTCSGSSLSPMSGSRQGRGLDQRATTEDPSAAIVPQQPDGDCPRRRQGSGAAEGIQTPVALSNPRCSVTRGAESPKGLNHQRG